jgi:hypothetical protein
VIADGKNNSWIFKRFSLVLSEIVKIMKNIKVEIEEQEYTYMKSI